LPSSNLKSSTIINIRKINKHTSEFNNNTSFIPHSLAKYISLNPGSIPSTSTSDSSGSRSGASEECFPNVSLTGFFPSISKNGNQFDSCCWIQCFLLRLKPWLPNKGDRRSKSFSFNFNYWSFIYKKKKFKEWFFKNCFFVWKYFKMSFKFLNFIFYINIS